MKYVVEFGAGDSALECNCVKLKHHATSVFFLLWEGSRKINNYLY